MKGIVFGLAILLILGVVFCSGCIGGHDCPKCGSAMDQSSRTGEPGTWWVCPNCHCIIDPQGGQHQAGVED